MFSWVHAALAVAGGMLGTAARAGLALALDESAAVVPVVNALGAFALGIMTGLLARRAESARTRGARVFFGTGVLGGFTTYSGLAVQSAADPWALAGGLASAVVGTAAAWGGLALAGVRTRPADPEHP